MLIFEKMRFGEFAIFYQTDIKVALQNYSLTARRCGRARHSHIDKGYIVLPAAEDAGMRLLWHKMVSISAAQYVTRRKSPFSHFLCFRKDPDATLPDPRECTLACMHSLRDFHYRSSGDYHYHFYHFLFHTLPLFPHFQTINLNLFCSKNA
jgi:hypothetical protein